MKTVYLRNNIVQEIIPEYALPVEKWYGADFASCCIEAPDDVLCGYIYDPETKTFSEFKEDFQTLKTSKLSALSTICNTTIKNGCDVTLSDGKTGHISLTDEDQINLTTAVGAINQGAKSYPYHLDGQLCTIYSAEDILTMGKAATAHKLYHTTYYNHLAAWVRRCETEKEVESIEYGAELPDDLKANMNSIIQAMGGSNG